LLINVKDAKIMGGHEQTFTTSGIFQDNQGNIVVVFDVHEDGAEVCYIYDKSKNTFKITNEADRK
jgi:hypothetical protein